MNAPTELRAAIAATQPHLALHLLEGAGTGVGRDVWGLCRCHRSRQREHTGGQGAEQAVVGQGRHLYSKWFNSAS